MIELTLFTETRPQSVWNQPLQRNSAKKTAMTGIFSVKPVASFERQNQDNPQNGYYGLIFDDFDRLSGIQIPMHIGADQNA